MSKYLLFFLALPTLICLDTKAQTWTGTFNSDWNNIENWNPKSIPTASGNVIIGPGATNWPTLSLDVTIGGLQMTTGSRLFLNGHTLTASSIDKTINIQGAILSGGHLNFSSASLQVFNGNTVNGNLVISVAGNGEFQEAPVLPNVYNGNVTFNLNGAKATISAGSASQFFGNLDINRNNSAATYIFHHGLAKLTGNFRFFTELGGSAYINQNELLLSPIDGKIDIDYTCFDPVSPDFIMNRVRNLSGGGKIKVRVPENINFYITSVKMKLDTLVVDSVDLRSFVSADITRNVITGNFSAKRKDGPVFTPSVLLAENKITGASQVHMLGTYAFSEWGNVFNGDISYLLEGNMSGGGICYDAASTYHGNVSIESHLVSLSLFYKGFNALDGDFSYTGDSHNFVVNETGLPLPAIGGKIFIDVTGVPVWPRDLFLMSGIKNLTPGGYISAVNRNIYFTKNSIVADSCVFRNFVKDGFPHNFYENEISGDLVLVSSDINASSLEFRSNVIGGNTSITMNNGQGILNDDGLNTFHGNVEYILDHKSGPSTNLPANYIGKSNPSAYFGNVTINRKSPADIYVFNRGFTALSGHFTYSTTAQKATYINPESYPTALIGGKVNITHAPASGNGPFTLARIKNNTTGGDILITNSGQFKLLLDTLLLNSLVASNFISPAGEHGIALSKITGNITITEHASNLGDIHLYGNIINGNTEIRTRSAKHFYQGFSGGDVFNGNVNIIREGTGNLNFSLFSPVYFNGHFTVNSSAGLNFTDTVNFGGNNHSDFEQFGTQPVVIRRLRILKPAGMTLTLYDPITISTKVNFQSGLINCIFSPLQFADNAIHEGASTASHVMGRVIKTGNDAFTFPTGSHNTFNPVSISAPASVTDAFSAEYFQRNPNLDGLNTTLFQVVGPNPVKRVSKCEYWNIQRITGSSNVALTFSYGDIGCPGTVANYISDPSKVRIVHWNGLLWQDLGNGSFTGTTSGMVTTSGPVSSFSPFTLASTDILVNALPLTLLSFNAIKKEGKAELTWETEHEMNVSHFEVQRSTNNVFETIAKIPAANTSGRHVYKTIDPSPASGHNYYRLKSVDIDGNSNFSHTVDLVFDRAATLQIWPNPAFRKMPVQLQLPYRNGNIELRLFNNNGLSVKQWNRINTAGALISLDVSDLPAGIYILQILHANETRALKLVIHE